MKHDRWLSGYWRHAHEIGVATYIERTQLDVDEQAGPAYFAGLGLSRWLFWQRLKWAGRELAALKGQCAIDFGCGFGLLLPMLRTRFQLTIAIDQVPELATDFMRRWDERFDTRETIGVTSSPGLLQLTESIEAAKIQPHSVDLILALDVLEHFEALPEIVAQLHGLLKPEGTLLVSGPTENWLYKLGRRIVGFSGDYHHQTIYQVESALSKHFNVETSANLPPLIPLFHLLKLRSVSEPKRH